MARLERGDRPVGGYVHHPEIGLVLPNGGQRGVLVPLTESFEIVSVGNTAATERVGSDMDRAVEEAMKRGGIADITTTGRKTGKPRRIEIYFHHFDGHYYLTGRHGSKRDWEANIVMNPDFMLHLKKGVTADVPVVGEPEPDPEERARILRRALIESWDSPPDRVEASLHKWVEGSPFIRFRPA